MSTKKKLQITLSQKNMMRSNTTNIEYNVDGDFSGFLIHNGNPDKGKGLNLV